LEIIARRATSPLRKQESIITGIQKPGFSEKTGFLALTNATDKNTMVTPP
jgi:hypothetical protein